jgi:putative ABC transport system permease protein
VAEASPLLEVDTYLRRADGRRVAVRVLGLDVLRAAPLAPALRAPRAEGEDRLVAFDPAVAFANAAALAALATPGEAAAAALVLQAGPGFFEALRVAGSVAAGGTPLVVMDLAGAQQLRRARPAHAHRPAPGARADAQALVQRLALPAGVRPGAPTTAEQRVSNLSRAYRVNLTVLALVALFVGAFLVFSVVSLSVAQRTPQLALLGVLGLDAAERRRWVLAECAAMLGAPARAGAAAGHGLAGGAAAAGRRPGRRLLPGHRAAAAVERAGRPAVLCALGWPRRWWAAGGRRAGRPAAAGAGAEGPGQRHRPRSRRPGRAWPCWPPVPLRRCCRPWPACRWPPTPRWRCCWWAAWPWCRPWCRALLALLAPAPRRRWRCWRCSGRATSAHRHGGGGRRGGQPGAGVALTVMVASFRDGVAQWLDQVLPADCTPAARAAARRRPSRPGCRRPPCWPLRPPCRACSGWRRPHAPLQLAARPAGRGAGGAAAGRSGRRLPLLEAPLPLPPGRVGVFVSEAMVALYGAAPGGTLKLPLAGAEHERAVRGVWRDYARQFGTVVDGRRRLPPPDRRRAHQRPRAVAGARHRARRRAGGLRATLPDPGLLEFASSRELRALSLRIFDRSFAVTYYLQAVAIAIGLVGIAASLSAQVLARRKEFGLLAHLGLTRRQVVAVVAGEARPGWPPAC